MATAQELFPLASEAPAAPLTHPAVKLYREICRLNANYVQRYNLIKEVGEDKLRLEVLRQVMVQFMMEHRNPKRVDWILERFVEAMRPLIAAPARAPEPEGPLTIEKIRRDLGYHGPEDT